MSRKYQAFISYRHMPLDKLIAKQLHRRIERWKIPKEHQKNGNKTMGIVFRDQDELPLSSNLTDDIYHALDNSRFLIVICTPDTPKSLWVDKEIEYFIRKHGRERVLIVLADGTPEASIPKRLTEVYDSGGQVIDHVEPLCANLILATALPRLKRMLTVGKLYGDEFLRLAAAMLSCPFDSLKQRAKRHRRVISGMSLSAVMLLFAVFSSILIGWNLDVTAKNEEISEKNAEISHMNEQLSAQLEQTLLKESETLSLLSEQYLSQGDRRTAVRYALDALPGENNPRPYYPAAEYALNQALYTYQDSALAFDSLVRQPSTDGAIESLVLSDDGSRAVTIGADHMYCFDTYSEEILWSVPITDINSGKPILHYGGVANYLLKYVPSGDRIVFSSSNVCTVLSAETGDVLNSFLIDSASCSHNFTEESPAPISISYAGSRNQFMLEHGKTGTVNFAQQVQTEPFTEEIRFSYLEYPSLITLSDDAKTLVYQYQRNYITMVSNGIVFMDVPSGEIRGTVSICTNGYPSMGDTFAAAFSPDGKYFATLYALQQMYLCVVDASTAEMVYMYTGDLPGELSDAAITFACDGSVLVHYRTSTGNHNEFNCVTQKFDTQGNLIGESNVLFTASSEADSMLTPLTSEDSIYYVHNTVAEGFFIAVDRGSGETVFSCNISEAPVMAMHQGSDADTIVCTLKNGAFQCIDLVGERKAYRTPYTELPFYVLRAYTLDSSGEFLCVIPENEENTAYFLRQPMDSHITLLTDPLVWDEPRNYYSTNYYAFPSGDRFLVVGFDRDTDPEFYLYDFVIYDAVTVREQTRFTVKLSTVFNRDQIGFSADENNIFFGDYAFDLTTHELTRAEQDMDAFPGKYYLSAGKAWVTAQFDYHEDIMYWWKDAAMFSSPCPYEDCFYLTLSNSWDGLQTGYSGLIVMPDYADTDTPEYYVSLSTADGTWNRIETPDGISGTPVLAVGTSKNQFALFGSDDTLYIIDHEAGKILHTWPMMIDFDQVHQMQFIREDEILLIGAGSTLSVIQTSDGKVLGQFHAPDTYNFREDKDNQLLYVCGRSAVHSGLQIDMRDWTVHCEISGEALYLAQANKLLILSESADTPMLIPIYSLEDLIQAGTSLLDE